MEGIKIPELLYMHENARNARWTDIIVDTSDEPLAASPFAV